MFYGLAGCLTSDNHSPNKKKTAAVLAEFLELVVYMVSGLCACFCCCCYCCCLFWFLCSFHVYGVLLQFQRWPNYLPLWNSAVQMAQLQEPSGGDVSGGDKQYMWYPRSQSSQNSSWSSLSEVPHIEQYLHSMHCHR